MTSLSISGNKTGNPGIPEGTPGTATGGWRNRERHAQSASRLETAGGNVFAGLLAGIMTLIAGISYGALIFSETLSDTWKSGSEAPSSAPQSSAPSWRGGVPPPSSSPVPTPTSRPFSPFSPRRSYPACRPRRPGKPFFPPYGRFSPQAPSCADSSSISWAVFAWDGGSASSRTPVVGGFLAGTGWLLVRGASRS